MSDTANLKAVAAALVSMASTLNAIATTMALRASQLNTLIGADITPAQPDPAPAPGSDHFTAV